MNTDKIKRNLKSLFTLRMLLGVLIGAGAGYAYYYYVGCNSGSCGITSSPVNSTLYGMLFGGLLFHKEPKEENAELLKQEEETNS